MLVVLGISSRDQRVADTVSGRLITQRSLVPITPKSCLTTGSAWASLLPSESTPVLRPAILLGGLFAFVAAGGLVALGVARRPRAGQEDRSSNSTRS